MRDTERAVNTPFVYKIEHRYCIEESHVYITTALSITTLNDIIRYSFDVLWDFSIIDKHVLADGAAFDEPRCLQSMLVTLFDVKVCSQPIAHDSEVIILDIFEVIDGQAGQHNTLAVKLCEQHTISATDIISAYRKAETVVNENEILYTVNKTLLYKNVIRECAEQWQTLAMALTRHNAVRHHAVASTLATQAMAMTHFLSDNAKQNTQGYQDVCQSIKAVETALFTALTAETGVA